MLPGVIADSPPTPTPSETTMVARTEEETSGPQRIFHSEIRHLMKWNFYPRLMNVFLEVVKKVKMRKSVKQITNTANLFSPFGFPDLSSIFTRSLSRKYFFNRHARALIHVQSGSFLSNFYTLIYTRQQDPNPGLLRGKRMPWPLGQNILFEMVQNDI